MIPVVNTSHALTHDDMLRLIEREVAIGDTLLAADSLRRWSSRLMASLDENGRARLEAASKAFEQLIDYEKRHGRFSRLDRDAPEILLHERLQRGAGLPSVYKPNVFLASGGETVLRASSSAAL